MSHGQLDNAVVRPHDVHIRYRATESLDTAAIAAAASQLAPDEHEQYERFHDPHDARDYACAHALLRTTLSLESDREAAAWRFGKTPAGKPFLLEAADAAGISFSLSHARGMVACAVTDAPAVGIDVESVDRDVDANRIAGRFFAPVEAAHLDQLDGDARRDRFFDLWTLKEALVKALGVGMAAALDRLAFTVGPDGRVRLDAPDVETGVWLFGLFAPGPRHRLAVAVRRSGTVPAHLIFRSPAVAG